MIYFSYKNGYVYTFFGRKVKIPYFKSNNFMRQSSSERFAINCSIQGTASDIIKKCILYANADILKRKLDNKIKGNMQIHDEIVFEVYDDNIPFYIEFVKNTIRNNMILTVPLEIDVKVSNNWIKK